MTDDGRPPIDPLVREYDRGFLDGMRRGREGFSPDGGLDVERLARALVASRSPIHAASWDILDDEEHDLMRAEAAEVAAEYAALATAKEQG